VTTTTEQAVALEVAGDLASHGVPIFLAQPLLADSGEWDSLHGAGGYRLPTRWEKTKADPAVLDRWRPGMAVCAVMGHTFDAIDVDPRHQGDETARGWAASGLTPRSFGRQTTPSGGYHDLVTPLGCGSKDNAFPGIDVKGGRADGTGRGFIFLAPTIKASKGNDGTTLCGGDGKPVLSEYRWTLAPTFDELDDEDDSGRWLAEHITANRSGGKIPRERALNGTSLAGRNGRKDRKANLADDVEFDQLDVEEQERISVYLRAAVAGLKRELDEVEGWAEGHTDERDRGWQKAVSDAAYRLGALSRASWTPWSVADGWSQFESIVPQGVARKVSPVREWGAQCDRSDPAPFPARPKVGGGSLSGDDATEFYRHQSMSDAHLGERVARFHLRQSYLAWGRRSWSHWDGRRWAECTETTVRRCVRDALMAIHAEETASADAERTAALVAASAEADLSRGKSMAERATSEHAGRVRSLGSLFNVGKIDAVMKVSRGFVECKISDFDQHPDLLTVGNGIVDLRTGELIPHDPTLKLTKATDVDYLPNATHAAWGTALEALPADVRDWMQVRIGQGATGHPPEDDVVPFCRGEGRNGKSTLFLGVMKALGEHCVLIPDKAILGSPSDHPTELMTLRGARLALLEELPDGDYLEINRLKKITGSVSITARGIGEDNTTFEPTHSLMVTTNYAVQIKAFDDGTWRRLALVRFPYTFGGPHATHQADPTLRPRIKGDTKVHEAVLAWIVDGALTWYGNSRIMPPTPADVVRDTEAWQHSTNDAARFLTDHLELDPASCVLTTEVYSVFKEWQLEHGRRIMSDQTFWDRASGHQWLASSTVTKTKVRTSTRPVSRSDQFGMGATPSQAMVLTGVRWLTPATGDGEQTIADQVGDEGDSEAPPLNPSGGV
jgi:P4 family phage/plasmid primase-like protien